jgi:uncharacterized protein YndB with AHSA1/START domain
MSGKQHVYVTYIATSAERVWEALTDGEGARRYWNGAIDTDWKPGSNWRHLRNAGGAAVIGGTIIETAPPRRLVMTWAALPDDHPAGRSQVIFDIEPMGAVVRLTVTHKDLDAAMAENVNGGWPRVLSSLKSLLETGKPLELWEGSTCSS